MIKFTLSFFFLASTFVSLPLAHAQSRSGGRMTKDMCAGTAYRQYGNMIKGPGFSTACHGAPIATWHLKDGREVYYGTGYGDDDYGCVELNAGYVGRCYVRQPGEPPEPRVNRPEQRPPRYERSAYRYRTQG